MARTTWKFKLSLLVLYAVGYLVFYIYPNFHPTRDPVYLPLLAVDRFFPLVPWTFFPYVSDYLLAFGAIYLLHDEDFYTYARMTFASLVLSGVLFMLFPTAYPRPPYPTVENPVMQLLLDIVSAADRPTNCFPSMHVANAVVATWCLRRHGPWIFGGYVLWTTIICLSTLTTKQHYFLDIAGGVAVVCVTLGLERLLWMHPAVKARLARPRR